MQQGRPLDSDRLELLAVRLESRRVYLIPRAILEDLVHAFPERAVQLIVSASPTGDPLDPSGLPQEVGWPAP
jgi:hypothetical protein